jgi:hypothetical protein
MARPEQTPDAVEERIERAEAALSEAIEERNRLWEELHRRKAQEEELAHYRELTATVFASRSWRLTQPLRSAAWFLRQLPKLGVRARRFLAHRPRT